MKKCLQQMKLLNNEKGIALVLVLIVFVIISFLGLTIMALAANNMKMSTGERNYQSAYYIAESGVTSRMNEISSKLNDVYGIAVNGTDFFNKVDGVMELGQEKVYDNIFEESFSQKPVAKIKIERVPSDTIISYTNDYKITSTGTINNRSRTVVKTFHITWKPKSTVTIPANTVFFVKNNFNVKNYKITGSVGSNGLITLQGGQASITGNKYNYVGSTLNMPAFPTFTPGTTNFEDTYLKMDRDRAFSTLKVNSNSTLIIDVGNSNKNLVVDSLNLLSYGKIKINGSGKLSIYAKNITMSSGSVINTDGNIEKLYMFLEGSGSSLNQGIIYGSMYANNTNLIVNNENGVQGHIITKGARIDITGTTINFPKMIYAPNAIVYLNASLSGAIICSEISSSGNDDSFKFEFVQINYDNSPLYVDNGTGATPLKDMITSDPVREQ